MLNYRCEDGVLTIDFEGRIDSQNAQAIGEEALSIFDANPHTKTVINAGNLEYISSAGLRVLLKIRKKDDTLEIVDVSPETYEILDMTGFTEMMEVKKAYREFSVDGCEVLGQGANGVVYRYNPELVVKVYKNSDALVEIHRERELAKKALVLGIPTAIPFDVVKVGDQYASVFELLNAKSFSMLIIEEPEKIDEYVKTFTDLILQIHSTDVNPDDMPDAKAVAVGWAEFLEEYLDEPIYTKLLSLIKGIPDRHTMIHGDYHTNNVELQDGEVLLIDMDTLSYGHPIIELASVFLAFVGYGLVNPMDIQNFMKIDQETGNYVWNKFLEYYIGTDDKAKLKEVADKAKIIGFTRMMRRTIRRRSDTEEGQKLIALCKENLERLVPQIDTLTF